MKSVLEKDLVLKKWDREGSFPMQRLRFMRKFLFFYFKVEQQFTPVRCVGVLYGWY